MKTIGGIAASPGIAIGPAFQYQRRHLQIETRRVDDPDAEWRRLQEAMEVAREQLRALCASVEGSGGKELAAIFQAQALMLDDPELLTAIRTAIGEQGVNAEAALEMVATQYADRLAALQDEYFRARAADVRDVKDRVLRILMGIEESPAQALRVPSVVMAHDLTPSDTAQLDKSLVLGFCTAEGGPMSHTAILARGLGLPAVVGAGSQILDVPSGATVILDGTQGMVFVEPDPATLNAYRSRESTYTAFLRMAREQAHLPAVTRDGRRVEVVANIGSVEGARTALEAGAEGVGLLRTEFLYLERDHLPDEEEQYQAYRAIVEAFGDRPVILRTLDIGGDKDLPYLQLPAEMNPFLGLRAIRLSLARPDLFRPQLRAALRAGAVGNLKIMFPMIATVEEVRMARALLEECRAELRAEGKPVPDRTEVGIMVEVPAAAIMADRLAEEVDFFSIGTNDLSQYTMAADRTNTAVAELASAFHPAVLRLVRDVIRAAHEKGKWVGLCGELAGEPLAIPILLGLGLDEFSMNPPAIPVAKYLIRSLVWEETQEIARVALELESAAAVREWVQKKIPVIPG